MKLLPLIIALFSLTANAAPPVIWNGTSAKWLPSGLQSAGVCTTNSSGVMSIYTTNGLLKLSSGALSAAVGDSDFQNPITLATFGSTPNSSGASFSGDTFTLQPANGSNPGGVSTSAQTFAGAKTFSSTIIGSVNGNAATVTTNANLTGPITSSGNATSIASQTGTGTKFVVDTSPTLVTPILGVASATSINKMAITAPATSSTIAVVDGKTFTASNTLTLSGTDGSTLNVGSGGTLGTAAYTAASAYEVPLTFSTGLTRTVNTIIVNAIQALTKISTLTTNGIMYVTGSDGTLNSGPLSGDITSSGLVTTLKNTGAGTGSCTNCSVTFDAQGRQTAYSSGTAGSVPRGYIAGLLPSNDGGTPNTVIDIAAGQASDSTAAAVMSIAAFTKSISSGWAVGTGNGCMDTGSVASSTHYKIWLIQRSDTLVVDLLCSTSATAPTMPTNYDRKRWIADFFTDGSSHFKTFTAASYGGAGMDVRYLTTINDITATAPGTSAVTRTMSVPLGKKVTLIFNWAINPGSTSPDARTVFSAMDDTDTAPASGVSNAGMTNVQGFTLMGQMYVRTNTSGQIRSRNSASVADTTLTMGTVGWIDSRGWND